MKEKENFGDAVIPICRVPLITSQKEEQVNVVCNDALDMTH
jgi:hypothetical protein